MKPSKTTPIALFRGFSSSRISVTTRDRNRDGRAAAQLTDLIVSDGLHEREGVEVVRLRLPAEPRDEVGADGHARHDAPDVLHQ